MKYNTKDKKRAGIYVIRVIPENKVYVGASINIYSRISQHVQNLTWGSKDANRNLQQCWNIYGRAAFEYFVVEYLTDISKDNINKKELLWMNHFDSRNPTYGYNLRADDENGMITHPETSKLITKKLINRFKNPDERLRISIQSTKLWEDPIIKAKMSKSVKTTKQNKFKFLQYTSDMTLVKTWDSVEEIINNNPTYKWQNIYSVCNGYKKRCYGYVWRKELKT